MVGAHLQIRLPRRTLPGAVLNGLRLEGLLMPGGQGLTTRSQERRRQAVVADIRAMLSCRGKCHADLKELRKNRTDGCVIHRRIHYPARAQGVGATPLQLYYTPEVKQRSSFADDAVVKLVGLPGRPDTFTGKDQIRNWWADDY